MTDSKQDTIAAVVVTYNRKDLLGQCLDALAQQSHPLDAVYIIDNCSTDGTYAYLLDRDWIVPVPDLQGRVYESLKEVPLPAFEGRCVTVRYVAMPENTGGAGGFNEGIKRAVDGGFDWIWLMDDDLLVSPQALKALVEKKEALTAAQDHPFLLNSLVLSQDAKDGDTLAFPLQELSKHGLPRMRVQHWRLSEVADKLEEGLYRWACPFNGTFLPASAISQIGLPNKDFFIWGDERDFLWRAAKVLDMYTVIDSKAHHPAFPGVTFNWKLYYHIRNSLVVNEHFNFTALRNLKVIVHSLLLGLRHGRAGLVLVFRLELSPTPLKCA